MIDAWLLRRFPGRTLEELDQIDWLRFLRALDAEQIETIEERRLAYIGQKIGELRPEEWERIAEHEQWLGGDV